MKKWKEMDQDERERYELTVIKRCRTALRSIDDAKPRRRVLRYIMEQFDQRDIEEVIQEQKFESVKAKA